MNRLKSLYDKWNNVLFDEEPRPRRQPGINWRAWRKVSNAPRLINAAIPIWEYGIYSAMGGSLFTFGLIAGLSGQFPPGLAGSYGLLAFFACLFIATIAGVIGLGLGGIVVEFREKRSGKLPPRYTADQILDKYGFNPDKTPKVPKKRIPKSGLLTGDIQAKLDKQS